MILLSGMGRNSNAGLIWPSMEVEVVRTIDIGASDKRYRMGPTLQASPQTILIVEDDEDMVTLLQFLLEREGYQAILASDGRQARTLFDTLSPPRLVLLDVMLPYHNGFELVTYIRSKEPWREVPIVMLTADSAERDIVRALDAGASDYVVKPFNPKELMARLRRFLKAAP